MHLAIVAVGRLKDGPERALAARYLERGGAMAARLGFSGPDVTELPESRQRDSGTRRADEARAIRAACAQRLVVALDETGKSLASQEFAARLAAWRDGGGRRLAFVIGGADGLDPELRAEAAERFAFGRATLPHQLVRIVLLEQIYRAMTILAGHPYHRES